MWSLPDNPIEKGISAVIKAVEDHRIYDEVSIYISKEDGTLLHTELPKSNKGKFSFMSPEMGYYKICVNYSGSKWNDRSKLFFKIKFMSDNMDEPKLDEALKSSDLDIVKRTVRKTIMKGERIIKQQENELDVEDKLAKEQISNIHYYYTLSVIQMIVVVGLRI